MPNFDVVVLGGGSAGEVVASGVAEGAMSVALVEEHLVGGEGPYVACMPSKTMLRAAHLRASIGRAAELGASAGVIDPGDGGAAFARAVARRDEIADHRDDGSAAKGLVESGVTIVRGRGRITG